MKMRLACVFTVSPDTNSSRAISAFDCPPAMCWRTSISRGVSSSSCGGVVVPGGGRWTKASTKRRVIGGASSVSPATAARTPATSSCGRPLLSRKPLAPARMAS